jgi:hypothetical protein
MSVVPALRKLKQEDHEIKVSLGYTVSKTNKRQKSLQH